MRSWFTRFPVLPLPKVKLFTKDKSKRLKLDFSSTLVLK